MVKVGQWIKILNEDGQYSEWANKKWKVESIAHNSEEHPGYDSGVSPAELISCEGLPVSLYDWEFEVTTPPTKKEKASF